MDKEERIKYLINQILYHKRLYYTGNALISDQAYDNFEDRLKELHPTNPILRMVGWSKEAEDEIRKEIKDRFKID